jgi:hypothetical protein
MAETRKGRLVGPDHPHGKGGRTVTRSGYVLIRVPSHPDSDVRGYIYEHRLVAERILGRRLDRSEHVHHRNHVKSDNRDENLLVTSGPTEHKVHHRLRGDLRMPGEENPVVTCLCGCGGRFDRYDRWGRPRRYISGHNREAGQWATPPR